jgi:uncharacterized membrane protein YccC
MKSILQQIKTLLLDEIEIEAIRPQILQAIAPTIVVAVLFFVNYTFFGFVNTMIGPFMTLIYLRLRNSDMMVSQFFKSVGIFLLLTAASFLAVQTSFLCVSVNFVAIFCIAFLLINEYDPTNYFPYGMALLFYQAAPVSLSEFPIRLTSVLASSGIIFIALLITNRRGGTHQLFDLAQKGLLLASELFEHILDKDKERYVAAQHELHRITSELTASIYKKNRAAFLRRSDASQYYPFIVIFQHINSMSNAFFQGEAEADSENNRNYLFALSDLFRQASYCMYVSNKSTVIRALLHFPQEQALREEHLDYNFTYVVNMLASTLERMSSLRQHNRFSKTKRWIISSKTNGIQAMGRYFSIRSTKLRFALRLCIVVTTAVAFAYISELKNAYSIPLVLFFTLLPNHENTMVRISQRLKGTILAVAICFVLFNLFPNFEARVVIMVATSFMIYFAQSYSTMVIYIICSALAVDFAASSHVILVQRLVYTAIAIALAYVASRWIFPTDTHGDMRNMTSQLLAYNSDMLLELTYFNQGADDNYYIRDLIIHMYLVGGKLSETMRTARNKALHDSVIDIIQVNSRLATDISHVFSLIRKKPRIEIRAAELDQYVTALSSKLKAAHQTISDPSKPLKGGACKDCMEIAYSDKILHENTYINRHLRLVLARVDELYDLVSAVAKKLQK